MKLIAAVDDNISTEGQLCMSAGTHSQTSRRSSMHSFTNSGSAIVTILIFFLAHSTLLIVPLTLSMHGCAVLVQPDFSFSSSPCLSMKALTLFHSLIFSSTSFGPSNLSKAKHCDPNVIEPIGLSMGLHDE